MAGHCWDPWKSGKQHWPKKSGHCMGFAKKGKGLGGRPRRQPVSWTEGAVTRRAI